tara:strand:+ start:222 stop:968 length:747 start_codon:yes stop_codon:yes gene_type:complete
MTINKSLEYVDGTVLDVDGHNENIYHATGLDHGLMSTANGRLAQSNLNSDFAFGPEHVWPGEVFRGQQDFQTETVDYFGDAHSDQSYESYVNVAGAALRVYFPYTVSMALWQCSVFISFYLPAIDVFDETSTFQSHVDGDIYVHLVLDGTPIPATRRKLPRSAYAATISGADGVYVYEHYLARPLDFSWMQTGQAQGWHDLQLRVYVENYSQNLSIQMPNGEAFANLTQTIFSRASFGIRNARVLTIL